MEELLALGRTPLEGANPTGESIRYDPDFDSIKAQITKLDGVEQEEPDWDEVRQLGITILESKSKDMLIASYLCVALQQTSGYQGLLAGLTILTDMLTNWWEDLFPELKRKRGRIAALEWLMERLTPRFAKSKGSVSDRETLTELKARYEEFFAIVRERLENDSPPMGDLRSEIDRQLTSLPKEKAPEAEKPAGGGGGGGGGIDPDEIEEPEDARGALKAITPVLKKVASVLRKADASDPLPYRLTRFAAWSNLTQVPPNQDGVTQIPAPRAEVLAAAENLATGADWTNLLELGEGRTGDLPFWLDASRHTATALSALGPAHDAARLAVFAEVGTLVKRLPDLIGLEFQGGVPFADDLTRGWIESEVLPALGGEGGENGAATSGGGDATSADPLTETRVEAQKLLRAKKIAEAMALFQHGAAAANSRRDRFRWKLALAQACFDAGQIELSMHQLASLDRETEEFHLDDWEPELSLDVVALLYKCQKRLVKGPKKDPAVVAAMGGTYARLCRIDPVAAMELK